MERPVDSAEALTSPHNNDSAIHSSGSSSSSGSTSAGASSLSDSNAWSSCHLPTYLGVHGALCLGQHGIWYPFYLVKTQQQVLSDRRAKTHTPSSLSSAASASKGAKAAASPADPVRQAASHARDVVRQRGVRGLYRGFFASQVPMVPCDLVYYCCYNELKLRMQRAFDNSSAKGPGTSGESSSGVPGPLSRVMSALGLGSAESRLHVVNSLAIPFVAGLTTDLVCLPLWVPFDVLGQNLMAQDALLQNQRERAAALLEQKMEMQRQEEAAKEAARARVRHAYEHEQMQMERQRMIARGESLGGLSTKHPSAAAASSVESAVASLPSPALTQAAASNGRAANASSATGGSMAPHRTARASFSSSSASASATSAASGAETAAGGSLTRESAAGIVRRIYREEGVRGFFKGSLVTACLYVPGSAVWWSTYESTKVLYGFGFDCILSVWKSLTLPGGSSSPSSSSGSSSRGASLKEKERRGTDEPVVQFLAGGTAGFVAAVLTNPIDVIKTRVQTHRGPRIGVFDHVRRLWREEGLRGFQRGIAPRVAAAMPSCALSMACYEFAMRKGVEANMGRC
uniref:Uncharacterized protein n=1 Tax=Chromera velia CCMP2878 TaxID=1169474 RepID=A0A0G4G459_9ALVE|eukprot:Cvel_20044.t1-p1 / transcript=Cvel_20044.t1 / gene=Cvel_20044 / organism=Chromera_velia_CCMP2878 / gene_product=Mitochondrial substrate carrier family protein J, putative / transcript_product=Mitochondrial substrate carrier family protein J, putative / location=Cvel_scaffold1771:28482-32704(+) / protein_length=572 / sequence_SO=supercontig / SO=protein_coding / is_pseudo=false